MSEPDNREKEKKYHHVIASFESLGQGYQELFTDLSENELRSKFVKPYLKGEHILCGNNQIDVFEFRKLMIIQTKEKSKIIREKIRNKSLERIDAINNSNCGIQIISACCGSPEDIQKYGKDVTNQFITKAVGSKKAKPWYVTLIITVTSGILVAGFIWWIGWK